MTTPEIPETEAREAQILGFMNKWVRITMADQRLVTGRLVCFDQARNIILHDGVVTVPALNDSQSIWHVLVPGQHIVKIEVEVRPRAAGVASASPCLLMNWLLDDSPQDDSKAAS